VKASLFDLISWAHKFTTSFWKPTNLQPSKFKDVTITLRPPLATLGIVSLVRNSKGGLGDPLSPPKPRVGGYYFPLVGCQVGFGGKDVGEWAVRCFVLHASISYKFIHKKWKMKYFLPKKWKKRGEAYFHTKCHQEQQKFKDQYYKIVIKCKL
jgi:hypothetical protein